MAFTMLKDYKPKPLGQSLAELDKIWAFVAEDGGPMIPIKTKDATELAKKATEQRKKGKCLNPVVKVGIENGNLLFRIEADNKYLESVVLVKGYEALKADRAGATVVNADPGDATIDKASADMAKVKGTTAKTAGDADLNEKGDKAPIIICAHGRPSGGLAGKVFATDFANATAAEVVTYIAGKKLAKNYAGIIYLDGCYTAAGPKKGADEKELTNYCKSVYEGLVKEGYKYLQVKGNLGLAATLKDGSESVLDAQQEAELKARQKKLGDQIKALTAKATDVQTRVDKLSKVADALVARHGGDAGKLGADPGIKLVKAEVDRLEGERTAAAKAAAAMQKEIDQIEKDMEAEGKYDIVDLVGVFGPEKLASAPWYKKLFG